MVEMGWFSRLASWEPRSSCPPSLESPPARSEKERRALVFTLVVDSIGIGIGGGTTTRGRICPVMSSCLAALEGSLALVCCLGGLVVVG